MVSARCQWCNKPNYLKLWWQSLLLGLCHDEAMKWKYFPCYWPYVQGIHRSPVYSSHKGQWHGALMFSLISAWTNSWVSNRDASDLRCCCTHYDVTVMCLIHHIKIWNLFPPKNDFDFECVTKIQWVKVRIENSNCLWFVNLPIIQKTNK